jgi:hypothetical protein
MDQGCIHAFQAIYNSNLLQQLVQSMDADPDFCLKEYWKTFSIASCVKVMGQSMKEMKKQTLNICWKKLWPECISDDKDLVAEVIQREAIIKSVVLARKFCGEGFYDMTV